MPAARILQARKRTQDHNGDHVGDEGVGIRLVEELSRCYNLVVRKEEADVLVVARACLLYAPAFTWRESFRRC